MQRRRRLPRLLLRTAAFAVAIERLAVLQIRTAQQLQRPRLTGLERVQAVGWERMRPADWVLRSALVLAVEQRLSLPRPAVDAAGQKSMVCSV